MERQRTACLCLILGFAVAVGEMAWMVGNLSAKENAAASHCSRLLDLDGRRTALLIGVEKYRKVPQLAYRALQVLADE